MKSNHLTKLLLLFHNRHRYTSQIYTKSNLKFKPLSLKMFFFPSSVILYYNFTNSNAMLRFKQRNEIKSATQTNHLQFYRNESSACAGYSYILIIISLREKDIFSYNNGYKNSLNNITH